MRKKASWRTPARLKYSMPKIANIYSREILDSRGNPTIETVGVLDNGMTAIASVPSGASTGKLEALELRDNDNKRYAGKGVLKAIANVHEKIAPAVIDLDPSKQFEIDQAIIALDNTPNKTTLGANAILSVSTVVCKLGAIAAGMPLYRWIHELSKALQTADNAAPTKIPTPLFNMINGGLHGAGNLDFQEFFVIPATSKSYSEALRTSVEVYHFLNLALINRGAIHSVGYEGGFAPNLFTNADALELNAEAITTAGYQLGQDFFLGLDTAASHFYKNGNYPIRDMSTALTTSALINYYENINEKYRMTVLEDPLQEDDFKGWTELTQKLGDKLLVVGDDLLVTNPERVKKAIAEKACNAILVKPNQIGTITETLQVIKLARDAGWKIVVSHRSGETNDWFIADFAVGVKSEFLKFGAPARGERVAKYNRLLSIEAEINSRK